MVMGMILIGYWVSQQIEMGVVNRTAGVTALYVNGYISSYIHPASVGNEELTADVEFFDELLADTALGQEIVFFQSMGA